jgi:hypothetical protein
MVQVFESERPRVGIAGRRKRPPRRYETSIYYTASDGRTILENENHTATLQFASKAETPSSSAAVSTSAVTPSTRKRAKKNVRKNLEGYDFIEMLDKPRQPTTKTDTSVQVSIDGDDQNSNEKSNCNLSMPVIEYDVNNDQEQIDLLTKQLQEKDELINQLLQSNAASNKPDTMMAAMSAKAKDVESMRQQLDEIKETHENEVKHLKLHITKWKDKAASLSLELERITKYNCLQHRNVYNGRYLLEETPKSESLEVEGQNELTNPLRCDKKAFLEQDKPLLPLQNITRKEYIDSSMEKASVGCTTKNFTGHQSKQQPIVSPRIIRNVTYLGQPLSFDHYAKFQLMVVSPDDEDPNDIMS